MSMRKLSLMLSSGLLLVTTALNAEQIPRLGANQILQPSLSADEVLTGPASGVVPAVADLGVQESFASDRRVAVAWVQAIDGLDYVLAALMDAEGRLIAGPSRLSAYDTTQNVSNPAIAVDGRGYFTVSWTAFSSLGPALDFEQAVFSRTFRFAEDGNDLCPADGAPVFRPAGSPVLIDTSMIPELSQSQGDSVLVRRARPTIDMDAAASGRTMIVFPDQRSEPEWGVWSVRARLEVEGPIPPQNRLCLDPHASLVLDGSAIEVSGSAESFVAPKVAVNENNDRGVIVWREQTGDILARRFDATGSLVGSAIEVIEGPPQIQDSVRAPDVAIDVQNNFRVVWERSSNRQPDQNTPAATEILMSSFDELGNVIESNVLVEFGEISTGGGVYKALRNPRIRARDLDGDFAVTWSQQQGFCNGPASTAAIPFVSSCSGGNTGDITLGAAGGRCVIRLASTGINEPRCRIQFAVSPFPGIANGLIQPRADLPRIQDDFGGGNFLDAVIDFPSAGNNERCAFFVHNGSNNGVIRLLRGGCQPGAPDCQTCEEQAQQQGIDLSILQSRASGNDDLVSGDSLNEAITGTDIRLRWFQSDWQADTATPVAPITVNQAQTAETNGQPVLAMGRDSDMLVGWVGFDIAEPELPQALVTQSLTGPVELSINDVGILEGPLGRATANFTLSANKPYPIVPATTCADGAQAPQPVVTLLTANGSATFQSEDYERTTERIQFADRCDPTEDWTSQIGFSVSVIDDEVFEGTESFFVDLLSESNAIVVKRQGVGAIVDNDSPSVVQRPEGVIEICEDGNVPLDDAPRCPEREEVGLVEIPVSLSSPQEVEGSVEFISRDGTAGTVIGAAEAGNDYEAVIGELQFLPGNDVAFLSIEIENDRFAELTEQFFVELLSAENLELPVNPVDPGDPEPRIVRVNILDDDTCTVPPQWSLPDPSIPPSERVLVADGPVEDRTGYFCVLNPAGYEECPWSSRLDLGIADEAWLTLRNVPFGELPSDYVAPPTPEEIEAGQEACSLIGSETPSDPSDDATGAIRYIADPNEGSPEEPVILDRSLNVQFLNGDLTPEFFNVEQSGNQQCQAEVTPSGSYVLAGGGSVVFGIDFGSEASCQFLRWRAREPTGDGAWASIRGANADGEFEGTGDGEITVDIDPFLDLAQANNEFSERRSVQVTIAGEFVTIDQEAPLFDHFDDGVLPSASAWNFQEPMAWSEAGTHLTAESGGLTRLTAEPAYPGCTLCALDTSVRFDEFSKGRVNIYLWWQSESDHLRLVANEFFDRWTLIQKVAGEDHEIRRFLSDIQVGREYPVSIQYRDDLIGPQFSVIVDGVSMCPLSPGASGEICLPWDPDPHDPEVSPVIGSGTVGFGVEATRASFNLLRMTRDDRTVGEIEQVFSDRFERP